MWAKVSISGYHMTPQEFFSGKLSKDIVRSTFRGRKRRKLTRAVFFLIVLNLTYRPRYNDRVNILSEKSPKHYEYHFFLMLFSDSVLCDSLWFHVQPEPQASLPFKFLTVFSNPWPLRQWCLAAISNSYIPFSSCPQSFPASVSFQWFHPWSQVANILTLYFQHQSFQE